jgi:hypothetical protein
MPPRPALTEEADQELLLSPAKARIKLAIGQTTYYLWIQKGWLHPIRFSRRLVRIRASEVTALIERFASNVEGQ